MNLKKDFTQEAKRLGVDLIGFAPVERFDSPQGNIPKTIFPETRTVICLGLQLLRGSLRGLEEGSNYFQYLMTGREKIEESFLPEKGRRMAVFLEKHGFTGCVQMRYDHIRRDDSIVGNVYYRSLCHNISAELQMDFEKGAVLCGIGELGMHGRVLTEEFGPFQCWCFLLTDAVMESDLIRPRTLCDECSECRAHCHGKYVFQEETQAENIGGENYTVYRYDAPQCNVYYHGANRSKNPWLPPGALKGIADRQEILHGEKDLSKEQSIEVLHKLDESYGAEGWSWQAEYPICGVACERACYAHLEEKDALTRKYEHPFRRRPEWSLKDDE